jgi:hypothetical protein
MPLFQKSVISKWKSYSDHFINPRVQGSKKAQELKATTDAMVYELYGFSEEEIQIVANN